MIEDELRREIEEDKLRKMEESYLIADDMPHWEPVAKTPYVENGQQYLFSKEELDEMETPQVSETMKKILDYHKEYIKFWRIKNGIER